MTLSNEDLYSCRYPTEKQTELACEHEAVNNRLKTYIEDITTLEINTVEVMENTTDVLIRQLGRRERREPFRLCRGDDGCRHGTVLSAGTVL